MKAHSMKERSMKTDSPQKLAALVQSLNLVPYFKAHPERSVFEAAKDLGLSPDELVRALGRLHCSGISTQTQDLLDLSYELTKGVVIHEDQGMDSSLRLTPTEAGALLLTVEVLETMPGLVDRSAVASAAEKLRSIMDERSRGIYHAIADHSADSDKLRDSHLLITEALSAKKRLRFDYWSASSNKTSQRLVDPARVFIRGDAAYLTAFVEEYGEHRNFRIDRMSNVEIIDEVAHPHASKLKFSSDDPFGFRDSSTADVKIAPEALWMLDEYDMERKVTEHPGTRKAGDSDAATGANDATSADWVQARMPVGSAQWFARFALSHADHLHVLGPDELVQAVHEQAQAGLQRYSMVKTNKT